MPEVRLQGPCIDSLVGQRISASMAQLMRVDLEIEPSHLPGPPHELLEACYGEGGFSLADEDERAL